jgi:hypothetical protein
MGGRGYGVWAGCMPFSEPTLSLPGLIGGDDAFTHLPPTPTFTLLSDRKAPWRTKGKTIKDPRHRKLNSAARRRTASGKFQSELGGSPARPHERNLCPWPLFPTITHQPFPPYGLSRCKIVGSGTLFAVSLYTWSQGASLPPYHKNRRFMFLFSGVFATAGLVRAAM